MQLRSSRGNAKLRELQEEIFQLSLMIRTSHCAEFDHPEFSLFYDVPPVMDPWIQWLVSFLEQDIAGGAQYRPGETLEVGWLRTQIAEHENGDMTVLEPDFTSLPLAWTPSVTRTLTHLFFQKYVTESVNLEMQFPNFLQTAIFCNRFGYNDQFIMSRAEPSHENEMDSGWFIGCADERHDHNNTDNLVISSLYQASVTHQEVTAYLALPVGAAVQRGDDKRQIKIAFNEEILPLQRNSYLYQLVNN